MKEREHQINRLMTKKMIRRARRDRRENQRVLLFSMKSERRKREGMRLPKISEPKKRMRKRRKKGMKEGNRDNASR
jgi:hypothetical protein